MGMPAESLIDLHIEYILGVYTSSGAAQNIMNWTHDTSNYDQFSRYDEYQNLLGLTSGQHDDEILKTLEMLIAKLNPGFSMYSQIAKESAKRILLSQCQAALKGQCSPNKLFLIVDQIENIFAIEKPTSVIIPSWTGDLWNLCDSYKDASFDIPGVKQLEIEIKKIQLASVI